MYIGEIHQSSSQFLNLFVEVMDRISFGKFLVFNFSVLAYDFMVPTSDLMVPSYDFLVPQNLVNKVGIKNKICGIIRGHKVFIRQM